MTFVTYIRRPATRLRGMTGDKVIQILLIVDLVDHIP